MPAGLRRIYSFNQTERDLWVAEQAAAVPAGSRVLDVGAGSCRYRDLFHHCEYQTQDFARLPPAELGIGLAYGRIDYVSDILAIPVLDGSFDVVLCTEVLEHVPEPILAVREFARILRPGGRLLLTTPLGSGLHQEPYHFYGGYTPYWFDKHLREAGFSQLTIQANGGFFKHYGQESQRLACFSTRVGLKGLAPSRVPSSPVFGCQPCPGFA
jgi:SAM-dependent methyltransferase